MLKRALSKLLPGLALVLGNAAISPALAQNQSASDAWLVTFTSNDIGTARTVMHFDWSDSTFTAHTRKKADRALVGFGTSLMGRVFTKSFQHGSLFRITNGKFLRRNDTLYLAGIFVSALGNYYFNGKLHGETIQARLSDGKRTEQARLQGTSEVPSLPLEDYPAVFRQAKDRTAEKIFDPSLLDSRDWRKFERNLQKVSTRVQDDLEMVFAFFYYADKLPFSHYALMKLTEEELADTAQPEPQVMLTERSKSIAVLEIRSFDGSAAEMDSVMNRVIEANYEHLIVDLRKNPGGSVEAGLTFVNRVLDSAYYGGVFLTQKWFRQHSGIPDVTEYPKFPAFSAANFDLIIEGIHREEGLCLQLSPHEHPFRGKLYILTSQRTASTCEPIVYGLKQFNRARIIGETTAGSMLNGERFTLDHGFTLIIPTATYYTSDGIKLDGRGVAPDVRVKATDALDYVLREEMGE